MVAASIEDRCKCCRGLWVKTPLQIYNRPGLDDIGYSIGDYYRFKQSMLARLSCPAGDQVEFSSILHSLKTREDDDMAIALLDCWAVVADILTFYQERIANESYLRTAKERISLMHLARLIGYRLRPGLAASTYVAFTLDEMPKIPSNQGRSPASITLPVIPSTSMPEISKIESGIKIQSIPGPGEKAQTYETDEEIRARVEWNDIKPKLTRPQVPGMDADRLFFEGTSTELKQGDGVLFRAEGEGRYIFAIISQVTSQPEKARTEVRIQILSSDMGNVNIPSESSDCKTLLADKLGSGCISEPDLQALAKNAGLEADDIFDNLRACRSKPRKAMIFRAKAAIFGHNAPKWRALPSMMRDVEPVYATGRNGRVIISKTIDGPFINREDKWADSSLQTYLTFLDKNSPNRKDIYLDNVYPGLLKGSTIVLRDDDNGILAAYRVDSVKDLSISDFTLSAKVTVITLASKEHFEKLVIRNTTVYAQSDLLPLAVIDEEKPFPQSDSAEIVEELNEWVEGMQSGQMIIVSGELYDARGTRASEMATLDKVEHDLSRDGCTRITLKSLRHRYVRSTVSIRGNISTASHGETMNEVLGSGDAGRTYQMLAIRQPPLTYLSSTSASGIISTLDVRVNDVLWKEVETLYDQGPSDRVYITFEEENGRTMIQFGDGRTGARVPTGRENIRAKYRSGIGTEGLVGPDKLSLLLSRPLGVKEVTNPLAAEGGADPENIEEARSNAPFRVKTLDRIVSLQDYEDFARSFAGIAKAHATWTWTGQGRQILITVAGPKGALIGEDSQVAVNLGRAMLKSGDPTVPINIQSYTRSFFKIAARVWIQKDRLKETVQRDVERALRSKFSFEARSLGQSVALSEVVATIQSALGVTAVSVIKLYRSEEGPVEAPTSPGDLVARIPRAGSKGIILPAELITLDTSPLADLELIQ